MMRREPGDSCWHWVSGLLRADPQGSPGEDKQCLSPGREFLMPLKTSQQLPEMDVTWLFWKSSRGGLPVLAPPHRIFHRKVHALGKGELVTH